MEKKYKVVKKQVVSVIFALALFFTMQPGVYALSEELVPLGRTTGMKFFSKGAMIVGFSQVDGTSPAEAGGLLIGDIIISVDGTAIHSNETLAKAVQQSDGEKIPVKALRDGKELTVKISPAVTKEGGMLIGAWVRDSMAGIGTITFVDPNTGEFAALGHGVTDIDTGTLMPMDNGSLMHSSVVGVNKGQQGKPGELKGEYDLVNSQGDLYKNTNSGVYGQLSDDNLYKDKAKYPLADKSEITKGKAYILSNVAGDAVEQYEIEIVKVFDDGDPQMRDMMVKVTDNRLIDITGGIVQGMSGSPILQNGKLIGAVTHVLVNDPQKGYGIAIGNMIEICK